MVIFNSELLNGQRIPYIYIYIWFIDGVSCIMWVILFLTCHLRMVEKTRIEMVILTMVLSALPSLYGQWSEVICICTDILCFFDMDKCCGVVDAFT